jgi:hypothetical protein
MGSRPDPDGGEPDGLADLTRRGPYDRLLTTEWLLLDDAPDEFVRRAASGEHSFFELQIRAPTQGRRCVVLLDSGPEMLGAPRIGQLAALVVMARRAEDAGAELHWGSLQGDPPLRVGLGRDGVAAWQSARSGVDPTPDRLAIWMAELGPLGPADELWLVGGARCDAAEWAAIRHRLAIEQNPEPEEEALAVRVAVGAAAKVVSLPLPASDHRVALIRRPLAPLPPTGRRAARSGGTAEFDGFLRFSISGARLIARNRNGQYLSFRATRDGGRQKPTTTRVPAGCEPVAIGTHRQAMFLVWYDPVAGQICHDARFRGSASCPGGPSLTCSEPGVAVWVASTLSFLDPRGGRWRWPRGEAPRREGERCLALGQYGGRPWVVDVDSGVTRVGAPGAPGWMQTGDPLEAISVDSGAALLRNRDGVWRRTAPATVWPALPGTRCWGWVARGPREIALVVSEPDGTGLRAVAPDGVSTPIPTGGPVLGAAASGGGVAWVRRDGELICFDFTSWKRMFCWPPERSSP